MRRPARAVAWQPQLLHAYHRQLCLERAAVRELGQLGAPSSAAEAEADYPLSALQDDFLLLGCAMLVVQTCFALTDVFKGWGNNKKNLLPWMVRLCRYTQRLDVARLCALLTPGEAGGMTEAEARTILGEMQQKAGQRLKMLEEEHGSLAGL